MTKKEVFRLVQTPYDYVADIMSRDEYLAGGDINHPDEPLPSLADDPRWGDACEHRALQGIETFVVALIGYVDRVLLCEICTQQWWEGVREEWLDTYQGEAAFDFFAYHMEMTKADFVLLAQNLEELHDLVCDIRDFGHHQCDETCSELWPDIECPATRPLGPGEYKAYRKWCEAAFASKSLAEEEEEWYRFKAEASAADEEYEEMQAAEAEATERAKQDWDASQKNAKAKYLASLQFSKVSRRVLPEPPTELLPCPLTQPDVPRD